MTSASQFLTTESIEEFTGSIIRTGRSKATAKAYAADLRVFQDYLLTTLMSEPGNTPGMAAEGWLEHSTKDVKPATVRRRKATVSRYLQFLGVDDRVDFKMPGAPPPNPTPVPNGMNGVKAMMLGASSKRDALLVAFGGQMGLRVSESVGIRYTDVDVANRTILVNGKGSKFRRLPMPLSVRELIFAVEHAPRTENAPELTGVEEILDMGNSTARRTVHEVAVRTFGEAEGATVSSHDLRATFATDMYRRTKDIAVVQKWLGHSSPETTQRYVQVDLTEMRLAMGSDTQRR